MLRCNKSLGPCDLCMAFRSSLDQIKIIAISSISGQFSRRACVDFDQLCKILPMALLIHSFRTAISPLAGQRCPAALPGRFLPRLGPVTFVHWPFFLCCSKGLRGAGKRAAVGMRSAQDLCCPAQWPCHRIAGSPIPASAAVFQIKYCVPPRGTDRRRCRGRALEMMSARGWARWAPAVDGLPPCYSAASCCGVKRSLR